MSGISFDLIDTDDPGPTTIGTGTVSAVPEPTSLLLLAGVIGLVTQRFRKKSAT